MNKIQKKFLIIFLLLFGTLVINFTTFAITWPSTPSGIRLDPTNSKLPDFIKYIYEWSLALGGLSIFIILVIAGIQYLTSTGNPGQITIAKERIKSAILGLILLLGSFLILNTINPILTSLPDIDVSSFESFNNCVEGIKVIDENGNESTIDGNEYCKKFFGGNYECKTDGTCSLNLTSIFSPAPCEEVTIYVYQDKSTYDENNLGNYDDKVTLTQYNVAKEISEINENSLIAYSIPARRDQCLINIEFAKVSVGTSYLEIMFGLTQGLTQGESMFITVSPDITGKVETFENFGYEAGYNRVQINKVK